MSGEQDKLNYIKNMVWMMCCDGDIADSEKKFLAKTANQIGIAVNDWNALMKEVLDGKGQIYQIKDRPKAIATFKSLVVMAKADKKLDAQEKDFLRRFAKSLDFTNQQFKSIAADIDLSTLLDPFKKSPVPPVGNFVAIKDDFEKIGDFTEVAREKDIETQISEFSKFLNTEPKDDHIVCFHAAEDKNVSIERCRKLLDKAGDKTAGILTRFQGHQVKYLREIGLKKCVIEPVYSHDIDNLLKES